MAEMKIPFHYYADLFPLIEGAEFDAIVADMKATGFRNGEEIVMYEGAILDGRNRYRAAVAAGIIPADVNPKTSWLFVEFSTEGMDGVFSEAEIAAGPLEYVISKNLRRRHQNESQRAMVAAAIANLGEGRPAKAEDDTAQICAVSQEQAAERLNVSRRLVQDAKTVRDKASPELRQAVEQGRIAVSAAKQAATLPLDLQLKIVTEAEAGRANVVRTVIKQGARAAREKQLGGDIAALPDETFGLIDMDPEHRFQVWSRDSGLDRAADNHYPTSEQDTIAARRALIDRVAAAHCVFRVWVTDLARGIDLMRDLGIRYVSYHVWIKTHQRVALDADLRARLAEFLRIERGVVPAEILVPVKPAGTGYWNRDEDELCLIGVRGQPVCPAMGEQGGSVWYEPKRQHSQKPEVAYAWADRHFAHTPRLEMNARKRRPGWQAWGNEVTPGDPALIALEREALARGLIDANGMVHVRDNAVVGFDHVTADEWRALLASPRATVTVEAFDNEQAALAALRDAEWQQFAADVGAPPGTALDPHPEEAAPAAVSKDRGPGAASFETRPAGAPQDEAGEVGATEALAAVDDDLLDIPPFLRRPA